MQLIYIPPHIYLQPPSYITLKQILHTKSTKFHLTFLLGYNFKFSLLAAAGCLTYKFPLRLHTTHS